MYSGAGGFCRWRPGLVCAAAPPLSANWSALVYARVMNEFTGCRDGMVPWDEHVSLHHGLSRSALEERLRSTGADGASETRLIMLECSDGTCVLRQP